MGKQKLKSELSIPLVDSLNYNSPELTKYFEIVNNKFIKVNYNLEFNGIEMPATVRTIEVVKKSFFNSKQFYNTIKYLNYFLTFFDEDKELLHVYFMLLTNISAQDSYALLDDFFDDLETKLVTETLLMKVINMVEYNIPMNAVKEVQREYDKGLQLTTDHLKALMGMGIYHKFCIPIVSKLITKKKDLVTNPKDGVRDVKNFYYYAMSRFIDIFDDHYDIVLRNKVYNTSSSRTSKTEHPQKIMWERKSNTGVSVVSFTNQLLKNIIIDISQKSIFEKSVIVYIHVCLDKNIRHSLQDDQDKFEFGSMEMRGSDSTDDSSSRFDKFQINASRVSEAYIHRARAIIKDTVKRLCEEYEIKITDEEEEFYRENMGTHDIQVDLLNIFYAKYFDSHDDFKLVNPEEIPKLVAVMKRVLNKQHFYYLPEIVTGKFVMTKSKRTNNRKVDSLLREDPLFDDLSEAFSDIKEHINMPQVLSDIGTLLSVPVMQIDFDEFSKSKVGNTHFDEETRLVHLVRVTPSNNFREMTFNQKILINELLRFIKP